MLDAAATQLLELATGLLQGDAAAAQILGITLVCCWGASFVALLLATDLPPFRDTLLSRVSRHGKLSAPAAEAAARAVGRAEAAPARGGPPSPAAGAAVPRACTVPAAAAWTVFYAFAVLWNAGWAANLARVLPPSQQQQQLTPGGQGHGGGTWRALVAVAAVQVHLVRRLCECLFVTKFTRRRMHPLNVCAGLGFYVLLCPTLYGAALLSATPSGWGVGLAQAVGLVLAVACNVGQAQCHAHLASLKGSDGSVRGRSGSAAEAIYRFPTHWLFSALSSAPHYTCEVGVYAGVLAMTGFAPLAWLPLLFTVFNLGISAGRTAEWYMDRFGKTPSRWKLLPFIF